MLSRSLALIIGSAAILAGGGAAKARRPLAVSAAATETHIATLVVWPNSIQFQATDPDSTIASSTVNALLVLSQGDSSRNWKLSLSASPQGSPVCASIPAYALKLSACATNVVAGDKASATCTSGTLSLGTSAQQVASGREGDGAAVYALTFNLSFIDSWRYVAQPNQCSFTLNYTADAP